jgi:hypothetical protein
MKKVVTTGDQPAKTDIKPEVQTNAHQKSYRDHKHFDHSHGRVNRRSIGMNNGPGIS